MAGLAGSARRALTADTARAGVTAGTRPFVPKGKAGLAAVAAGLAGCDTGLTGLACPPAMTIPR